MTDAETWAQTLADLHELVKANTRALEKKILRHIRHRQGPCFGGWGWVYVPVSRVPGNVHPDVVKGMIARGILVKGRHGCILGISGEVEDDGAQTGRVIKRGER